MKKIIISCILLGGLGAVYAVEDVREVAYQAVVGSVTVSTSTATAMFDSTLVGAPFAFNICNEDSRATIRCGYSVSVSTYGANLGFPVRAGTCEYRAVGYTASRMYCKAEGTTPVTTVREIFGRDIN